MIGRGPSHSPEGISITVSALSGSEFRELVFTPGIDLALLIRSDRIGPAPDLLAVLLSINSGQPIISMPASSLYAVTTALDYDREPVYTS